MELQHEYGGIGMLHVKPEYRRNKLGSIATRTLANKLIKDGQLVFALVDKKITTSPLHFMKIIVMYACLLSIRSWISFRIIAIFDLQEEKTLTVTIVQFFDPSFYIIIFIQFRPFTRLCQ